jgi:hypothetical protein
MTSSYGFAPKLALSRERDARRRTFWSGLPALFAVDFAPHAVVFDLDPVDVPDEVSGSLMPAANSAGPAAPRSVEGPTAPDKNT